ncbi:MAG: type II secretion system F family protein [Nocardioides sp.]|uniref:type II secretion system F family protein n=1 Tax=Nocardioides sp. TaxID=35761 RepID=UPI0039E2F525
MTMATWGAVLGGCLGLGVMLIVARLSTIRRPQLSVRVLPYLRDLPEAAQALGAAPRTQLSPTTAAAGVFGPMLVSAGHLVERTLGGSASVRRRLERAGLQRSVQDFRIEQVVWGLVAFVIAAAIGVVRTLAEPSAAISSLVVCALALVLGVMARDSHLSGQVKRRERAILMEFPTVAELLALAVAAGESPVSALDRVVRRSGGELSRDLAKVLAAVRTGEPVGVAFDRLAATTGIPLVARFADGIAVAVERGTPLADVLHAQAADVREAGRRELIEAASRKEIFMMVPVVFLVLPVTVLFALWPGVLGLSFTTP